MQFQSLHGRLPSRVKGSKLQAKVILQKQAGNKQLLQKQDRLQRKQCELQAAQLFVDKFSKEDDFRERDRRFRRTVYTHEEWRNHRSVFRYFQHIYQLHRSSILRSIFAPIVLVTFFSSLVCAYNAALAKGVLRGFLPQLIVPQTCINLPSFALSLLLVFRTNSSYGRWDEARKMWGLMLNRSRDLSRQATAYFPPHALAAKRMLARWTIAFQKSFLDVCRPNVDFDTLMGNTLRPEEMAKLKKAPHKVVYSLSMMSEIITAMHVHPQWTVDMMSNLTTFHDILGGCERLLRTPIPLHYTRFTSRGLLLWLALLPMALWTSIGWAAVPVTTFMATLLMGIEEIGVQIEDPFGVLALEIIQKRAEADVMSQVDTCTDNYEYVQDQLIREGALTEQGPPRVFVQGVREGDISGQYGYVYAQQQSDGHSIADVMEKK